MFLTRAKCVLAVFLIIFLIQSICGKKSTIPNDLFRFLRTMNSSLGNPTEELLKYLSPGTYKQGNNFKQLIKSRNLGNIGEPRVIEHLNLDEQHCNNVSQVYFLDQPPVNYGYLIWPFAIKRPVCIGSCGVHPDLLQCVSTKRATASVPAFKVYFKGARKRREIIEELSKDPVNYISKRSTGSVVHTITVPYDVHCACKCRETPLTCAVKGQIYNDVYCRCDCPNVQTCAPPFKWDDEKCRCVCGLNNDIMKVTCLNTYGRRGSWNEGICDCKCTPCRRKFQYHVDINGKKSCRCACNVKKLSQSCSKNQRSDKRRCTCRRVRRRRPRPVGK